MCLEADSNVKREMRAHRTGRPLFLPYWPILAPLPDDSSGWGAMAKAACWLESVAGITVEFIGRKALDRYSWLAFCRDAPTTRHSSVSMAPP